MTTSETVVVDALPYIDHGYDEPGVREAAIAMVEEETRRYRLLTDWWCNVVTKDMTQVPADQELPGPPSHSQPGGVRDGADEDRV